jgi:Adenine-specific methyltransferase EcoRI
MDYADVMGVPITFLEKYNPSQFHIMGITDRQNSSGLRTKKYGPTDSLKFNDLNARSVLFLKNEYKQLYARILIKKNKDAV